MLRKIFTSYKQYILTKKNRINIKIKKTMEKRVRGVTTTKHANIKWIMNQYNTCCVKPCQCLYRQHANPNLFNAAHRLCNKRTNNSVCFHKLQKHAIYYCECLQYTFSLSVYLNKHKVKVTSVRLLKYNTKYHYYSLKYCICY